MKKLSIFVPALLLIGAVAANAQAKPVYLTCTFMVDGKPDVIDFTLNEERAIVSRYVRHSGYSRTESATFTPDRIAFGDNQVRFEIDRKSLRIASTIVAINSTDIGSCREAGAKVPALGTKSPSPVVRRTYFVSGLDPQGDNWLALKQGPDLKSARLRKLPPGTPLTILDTRGGWYRVELSDGTRGWVSGRFVSSRRPN